MVGVSLELRSVSILIFFELNCIKIIFIFYSCFCEKYWGNSYEIRYLF